MQTIFYFLVFMYTLGPSTIAVIDSKARVRAFTRPIEFDFVEWTMDALEVKLERLPLNTIDYLDREGQRQIVFDYINLIGEIQQAEGELNLIYTNPEIDNPESQAKPIRENLDSLYNLRADLAPLAENVLQEMLSTIVAEMGFTPLGQPIPPVMYHSTPLPWALIVSPRERIEQEANISLETTLTLEDHILLENEIAETLDVSTLVVPIGGVGTYPTMVAQTTNLNWLATVIAHEWIHNYLTLRPLGIRYEQTPELRTMNETTAKLAGNEIGAALIAEFFPERVPPPPPPPEPPDPQPTPEPERFDFRAEMYETRIQADALLAEGRVEDAENYMEQRRLIFWENGYRIRKLNQAYFAFYGAYADQPVSSAGEDPVGAAVRQLRAEAGSLIEFVDTISKFKSFEELQNLLQAESPPG
ncbi:MAG TPA: hypothetical protein VLA32_08790 [Anaerolineales bacterium]|nr:hypothetical protein [Anaerolineales bacterium]